MARAVTYSTTGRARDLRTVIVDRVKVIQVLTPSGLVPIATGTLLHGPEKCAHEWWDEILGTGGSDFAVPASLVKTVRAINV